MKRVLGFFLSMALLLGVLPGIVAFADETALPVLDDLSLDIAFTDCRDGRVIFGQGELTGNYGITDLFFFDDYHEVLPTNQDGCRYNSAVTYPDAVTFNTFTSFPAGGTYENCVYAEVWYYDGELTGADPLTYWNKAELQGVVVSSATEATALLQNVFPNGALNVAYTWILSEPVTANNIMINFVYDESRNAGEGNFFTLLSFAGYDDNYNNGSYVPEDGTEIYEIEVCPSVVLTFTVVNGEASLSDCTQNATGALTIPSTCNGFPVTKIGNYAFELCTGLTLITIPDSVTSIGWGAFLGCARLTSITIPDKVSSIGNVLFSCCEGLTSIVIPDSVTSIGNMAFYNCSRLTSITIPDSVRFIGNYAFGGCCSMPSIMIPDSVTSIGAYAFRGCSSLTSITIPDSVTSIGDYAFYNCSSLTSITIPDSVTSIGYYAFENCSSLTPITIPDSVTSIGARAFSYCNSLTSITIPDSVTSIGDEAFSNCDSLTSITIGNGVTSIGDWAFSDCSSLTSITIGNGVTSIGNKAFASCDSLTSIIIPYSVTSIGGYAFRDCDSLTDIYCVAESKPTGWDSNWKGYCYATVHWDICPHEELEWVITKDVIICVEDGCRDQKCIECGKVVATEIIPAHTPGEWTVTKQPKGFVAGRRHMTCTACNTVYLTETIYDTFGLGVEGNLDKILTGFTDLVSSAMLKTHYANLGYSVTITDKDGGETEFIATGAKVFAGGDTYEVVVKGDTTGDGIIDIFDLSNLLGGVNGEIELSGVFMKAGLIVNEEIPDIFDLTALLAHVNGDRTIEP